MKRLAACVALLVLAAGAAAAPPRGDHGREGAHRRAYADPSALFTAEIAFKQLAQRKGQWAAWLETSAPTAQVFAPELTSARDWLKGRAEPAASEQWDAYQAWMSCDGAIGVTRGAWTTGDRGGQFVTIWQRQPKGGYKWVLRQEMPLAAPPAAPEMLSAFIADCDSKPPAEAAGAGKSDDGTVRWTAAGDTLIVRYWKDGAMREVFPARP